MIDRTTLDPSGVDVQKRLRSRTKRTYRVLKDTEETLEYFIEQTPFFVESEVSQSRGVLGKQHKIITCNGMEKERGIGCI